MNILEIILLLLIIILLLGILARQKVMNDNQHKIANYLKDWREEK